MNMRVENWCGYEIRFIEENGEWWAILKDICDALGLRVDKVSQRIDPSMLTRVPVKQSDHPLRVVRSRGDNETRWMIVVNEYGIYEALFASRKLEARKFRLWSAQVMKKLRQAVGLEGYEVMKMTDTDVQARINHILDTLYVDEETGKVMRSVTIAGGDVEQVEFA